MGPFFSHRLRVLKIILAGIFVLFAGRLFELQVLRHDEFAETARAQHQKRTILDARRGKILVHKNALTDELSPVATNNTLQMLFVDPLVVAYPRYTPKKPLDEQDRGDARQVAKILAPLLIQGHCDPFSGCILSLDANEWTDTQRLLVDTYERELFTQISEIERSRVILLEDVAESRGMEIRDLNLSGIDVIGGRVTADPTRISDVENTADELAPLLGVESRMIRDWLTRRYRRYSEIAHKLTPEISTKIAELKSDDQYREILRGVQLRDEHWRYYPEKSLAAQVLGFVDREGSGQYGIEGRFDYDLRGRTGLITGATNVRGQQIFGAGLGILRAEDGADIVLSIDRVIQSAVERILLEDIQQYDADAGQVIVIDPQTGKILAMSHAPTFDPNEFGEVYATFEVPAEQAEREAEDETFNHRIPTIKTDDGQLFRYFNIWGPAVFRNRIVSDEYEPGSVIKALTMAAALNSDEVTPTTTYEDTGPVEVDEFEIKNADEKYLGTTTMIDVINRSLNTGIAFLTQKMGAQMVYDYFKNWGFGQYTDIQLDGETQGQLEHWHDWEASELVTRGFGQGMTASPLQVALSIGSLANGGYLMKPMLVEEIRGADGNVKKFEPERVRRVVSEDSANLLKAMLLNSVTNGMARGARVWGHSVMGKTGTSQTYRNGKAQTGAGTTIASFAGFGPLAEPKFVVLVKLDYPKTSQWGSETAAGTFRRVADFLFDYYNVPPEN